MIKRHAAASPDLSQKYRHLCSFCEHHAQMEIMCQGLGVRLCRTHVNHLPELLGDSPFGTHIYRPQQVADALGLSYKTILRNIKSGKLEARKTGKQFLITREAVNKYWDSLPKAGKPTRQIQAESL